MNVAIETIEIDETENQTAFEPVENTENVQCIVKRFCERFPNINAIVETLMETYMESSVIENETRLQRVDVYCFSIELPKFVQALQMSY